MSFTALSGVLYVVSFRYRVLRPFWAETEGGNDGKSNLIASNKNLESKLFELCKERRKLDPRLWHFCRIDARNQTNKLEKTRQGTGKLCAENWDHQENFRKTYMNENMYQQSLAKECGATQSHKLTIAQAHNLTISQFHKLTISQYHNLRLILQGAMVTCWNTPQNPIQLNHKQHTQQQHTKTTTGRTTRTIEHSPQTKRQHDLTTITHQQKQRPQKERGSARASRGAHPAVQPE